MPISKGRVRMVVGVASAAMALLLTSVAIPAQAKTPTVVAEPIATGLEWSGAFTFAPDGRIFYGERLAGNIRILDPDTGSNTIFYSIPDVLPDGERGLLGVALHPRYPDRPVVYAYVTRDVQGVPTNQIVRLIDSGGVGTNFRVIFTSDVPSELNHNGGRILFGPDRMLYVIIGDARNPANSQDLDTTTGKILRLTPTGQVPPNNPFPGNPVFAYGIRNSYGFAFDPLTRLLWESENGPRCNDEINLVQAGMNYGWGPSQTCEEPPPPPLNTNQDGPDPQLPETWFTPVIAPTGAAFCAGCGLPGAEGSLWLGVLNKKEIRQVTLTPDRMDIASIVTQYVHPNFGVLSLERGPDGSIYFSDLQGIFRLVAS